jgi:hypothetical protein
MEYKLKIKNKKFLTVTVLTLFLLSATAISTASAQLDTTRIPDQTPTDANSEPISDNPTLYTAQDNSTTATDDNSILDRSQDNSTASTDDSTLYDSANSESNSPNLIATQAKPDYLAIIIALVACPYLLVDGKQRIQSKQNRKKQFYPFFPLLSLE